MSTLVHRSLTQYAEFRKLSLAPPFTIREPADFHDPIPISERLVQVLWADQLFNTNSLQTRNGQPLKILHPGRWNVEGGPDFKGAQIQIDEKICKGDVEVHLNSTGWDDHRHNLNPSYDHVILDVSLWEIGDFTWLQTYSGRIVPQFILNSYLECSLDELVESLDPDRYPLSPLRDKSRLSPFLQHSAEEISKLIQSAGLFRFQQKATKIRDWIIQKGTDQTAYQLLAEALGYKHNKLVFREITRVLPLQKLLSIPSINHKIHTLLSIADQQGTRLDQVRPANHPDRRLAALAMLAELYSPLGAWFLSLLKQPKDLKQPPILHHPFWSWHYHRESRPLTKSLSLIGQARWNEIVANVILPFCAAEAKIRGDRERAQSAQDQYLNLEAGAPNLPIRQLAYDLGIQSVPTTLEQQGLIQIYQDFDLMVPNLCYDPK